MDRLDATDGVFDWGLLEPAGGAGQGAADDAVLEAMVAVERALVLARAAAGEASGPSGVADAGVEASALARAEATAARLDAGSLDRAALRAGARSGGVAVIELVAQLRAQAGVDPDLVHTGATSQDVVDTALVVVSRDVLTAAADRLRIAGGTLADLADRERARPIVARTLGRPAEPTTFGVAAAGWLDAVSSALEALGTTRYPVQLGGAIGTGEAFARSAGRLDAADRTRAELAAQLGLDDPGRSWHTDRSPVLGIANAAAQLCAAAGRIGRDLALAARDDIAGPAHGGGSSSMPHKRNPVDAVVLTANALRAPGALATLHAAAVSGDFRPTGEWHAEWQAWRGLLRLAAESAEVLAHAASDLVVAPDPGPMDPGDAGAVPLDPTTAAVAGAIVDRARARFASLAAPRPEPAGLRRARLQQKDQR